MSSAKDIASSFSISGLLDASSKTRERYPVCEIEVDAIEGHPANVVYSMEESSIQTLARSIKRDGLTDLPLVRKLDDGTWQMISGHRRLAAYRMLSETDGAFAKIPCRVIEGITDSQAVTLLHTANYFVRALTVTERARATEALGVEAERLRASDPALKGKRTEDIKAAMIAEQTGKAVSGKTIQRDEKLAKTIEEKLSRQWAIEANEGRLSTTSVNLLKGLSREKQARLFVERPAGLSRNETTDYLKERLDYERPVDKRLLRALEDLESYMASMPDNPSKPETDTVIKIRRLSARIAKMCG